jgi:2,3-bisphosphoglycerate-dependent phosphoglycerate mutase
MCEHRAFGYWQDVIAPRVRAGERVLIVAHANTIRALVKAVDNISDQKIEDLHIPNGVPLGKTHCLTHTLSNTHSLTHTL